MTEISDYDLYELLDLVIQRLSVSGRGFAAGGYASKPPINLDAVELRDLWVRSEGDEQAAVRELVERVVDGRGKMPAGHCPRCERRVFAYPDELTIPCPTPACGGKPVDVELNRRRALTMAQTKWLSAAEIERESPRYGITIKAGRVRMWANRGRLHGINGSYRLADVLRLADGG